MGGLGSGSWYRHYAKGTTESQRRVDIRYFRKAGHLKPGTTGTLVWSCDGESCGSLHFKVSEEAITLEYMYSVNGGDREEISEVIHFDKTPCNYGGYRKWFLCPGCSHRVAILYGMGRYFLCRHCYDLVYTSQREDEANRAARRSRNIIERLGGDPEDDHYPEKPKGMHWRTYNRMIEEAEYYDQLADTIMMTRILRWLPL